MMKKVSIQGYEGSFHQIAARQFLGDDVEVMPCASFREVVKLAADPHQTIGGFMAIENSIAGSILPNYNLLQHSGLHIEGEIYLQVHQNLMTLPGVGLHEIREVHSHPMAILQCLDFLQGFPEWKLVESEDTALSARHIRETGRRDIAAIASSLAAELYQLHIAKPEIQTIRNNYTRFLYIKPGKPVLRGNKASINFHTDHSKGSLARVLTRIAEADINLSKLQSMPIPEQEWKYSFHADMEFERPADLERVLETIIPVTSALKLLGVYEKGKTIR